jgi:ComF family protein
MKTTFKRYINLLLDFIYPRVCVSCEKNILGPENHLCIECLLTIPKTNSHLHPIELLERKFWGKLNVKQVYSFLKFSKKGKVQNILHTLKYKNKPELAEYIGKMYANDLMAIQFEEKIDLIIGIPLHKDKQKLRGYNQADAFAKGLSEVLKTPYDEESFVRQTFTISQTKTGSRFKRFKNIEGVFEVKNPENIEGRRIALVDDVLTTGSTLEEAGKVLLAAGCSELYIITIASAY